MSLFFWKFKRFCELFFRVEKYKRNLMILNPFAPLVFIKIASLKATTILLLILLLKSNLLRLKGGLIGGLFALILISGILASTSIAVGSLIYAYRVKNSTVKDNPVQDLETVNV